MTTHVMTDKGGRGKASGPFFTSFFKLNVSQAKEKGGDEGLILGEDGRDNFLSSLLLGREEVSCHLWNLERREGGRGGHPMAP